MAVGTRMQQRRATEAVWSTSEYVLAPGELGVTTDTGIIKVGNGTSPWSELDIALGSEYLPILGKAADSELLDGIDSDGFYKLADASTAATADKLLKRLSDGRAQGATATSGDDLVNYTQWQSSITTLNASIASSIIDGRKVAISRTLSNATTTFALEAADVGAMVVAANSSLTVQRLVTIPTNASVPIAVGSWIDICSSDEGNLKLSPAGGVTLNGRGHIFGQYSIMRVLKTATDTWMAFPQGARRGRVPKIRVIRTGSTGWSISTDTAVPFDTTDANDTFNPDNEWFTIPGSLPTTRRVVVNYTADYLIDVKWSGSTAAQGLSRINFVTGSGVVGTCLASAPTFSVGTVVARVRLTAGQSIGAVHYNNTVQSDLADGTGGHPHYMSIMLLNY